jgi:hypothetical protein
VNEKTKSDRKSQLGSFSPPFGQQSTIASSISPIVISHNLADKENNPQKVTKPQTG